MKKALLFLFILLHLIAQSQNADSLKVCTAVRVSQAPKIDGKLDDDAWTKAIPTSGFTQRKPDDLQPEKQHTEVKIVYTDYAIYVGAYMYDTAPDSILKQLGKRDEENLNAEKFYIKIDPYHNNQDAFLFGVYASGIQLDSKFSDETFDAVWNSDVSFPGNGWIAEMEIPYSAIRFPEAAIQSWKVQFTRDIRRTREYDLWAYVPPTASNAQMYWGTLEGIKDVKTPTRLSLIPYAGINVERAPVYNETGGYNYSNEVSYSIGADLKYGIDDRFTLDMSLLPDFGQVQSDKTVKNLSYRETEYDENRPFFKEGVELFQKGNLFYSRRIGKVPTGYYDVFDNLADGETVEENPSQVKLLNATKISGRTNEGLGLGFFNAITDNTYAVIKSANGETRKVLTEPLTNYNIIVLDQQFKNNSNIYLVNTSTLRRTENYRDANVTGAGFKLGNKKNTYKVITEGSSSQLMYKNIGKTISGFKYHVGAEKLGGNFPFGFHRTGYNNNYRTTDLGYFQVAGRTNNYGFFNFNRYSPWKFVQESTNSLFFNYETDYNTHKTGFNEIGTNLFILSKGYTGYFINAGFQPIRPYDYYEARTPGKMFRGIRYWYSEYGVSSDYRKPFAVDYSINVSNFIDRFKGEGFTHNLSLRIRPSDKLFIIYGFTYAFDPYNLGYADDDGDDVIFGVRRLYTYENTLDITYTFVKDMRLTVSARHYWNTGKYRHYYTLQDDGELIQNDVYAGNNDFNFNVMNIDVVYEWRFSPGSVLNFIYKNGIQDETGIVENHFDKNIKTVFKSPQTNIFAVKLLYYLDYQKIHVRKHS